MHLEIEGKGDGRKRGLDPNDKSQLQTYEIYIPNLLRSRYDNYFKNPA